MYAKALKRTHIGRHDQLEEAGRAAETAGQEVGRGEVTGEPTGP